ncbi:MAG: hypothetical protein JWO37_273 [Acidimicrobiales bacterium]|jgi:hypothetical protein|nr:hypothetical protein [Acidimicrobiales bacterium]
MRNFRRVGALGLTAFVASAFVAGSARADTPEVFLGQATGQALHLNVLGLEATLGQSLAKVQSALTAEANGAGDLAVLASTSTAKATQNGQTVNDPNKCATPALPAAVASVLNAGLGCSTSSASIVNGAPAAHSEGSVASIDLSANNVLKSATANLPIGQTLDQVLTPVLDTINKVTGQTIQLSATDSISDLLNALTTTQTLAVRLGKSTSDVTSSPAKVVSTGTDAGGQIDILPVGALNNTPLASIVIGSAKASVAYDRATGKSAPSWDPAIVTVKLASFAGLPATTLSVAPGKTQTLFPGTPLESTISVADGRSFTDANGAVHAVADGVSLHLFKGLGVDLGSALGLAAVNGAAAPTYAVALDLAHAEALGGGALPTATPVAPVVLRDLPRTGGTPWLPIVGGVMALVAYLTRRYALGRS